MAYFDSFLHYLLIAAIAWAILALLFIWLRTRAYGKRELFAAAAGSEPSGAIYAFTMGMMPWAKESIRENLSSYAMGIAYHVGIFAAIALLALYVVGSFFPAVYDLTFYDDPVAFGYIYHPLSLLTLAFGITGGVSLFAKRVSSPVLKAISCPDDFISNALATVFVSIAFAMQAMPWIWVERTWCISAIALFAYLPLGKIRHCCFFFVTRYHFGAFFGRRGCMPPSKRGGQYV